MPLQKQVISIPFSGLQTKVDPKVAPLGTFATIDNFIMNRYPELVKRDGLSIIGESTTPSNITTSYNYLNEMGVITNNSLYSYSSSLDKFQLKGLTASPIITAKPIISNTYTQVNCDSAVSSDSILCSVWEDSRGGVRYTVKDLISDTFLVTDTSISTTGTKPKVIYANSKFVITWVETSGTALKVALFNIVSNTLGSSSTVTSSLASCYTYDIIKSFSNALIVVVETTASPDAIKGYYWNVTSDIAGASGDGFPDPASLNITNSGATPPTLSLATDSGNTYVIVTLQNNSKQVYTKAFYPTLIAITSEVQVASATTDAGWGLATCVDSSNNTYIFYSTKNTAHTSYQSKVSANITTQTIDYNRLFYVQFGVASKAFYYSNNAYVVLSYDSSLQATYFGLRDDGACFGRLFASLGGGSINKANCVTSFNQRPDKDDTYIAALLKKTKVVSSANSFFSTTSVFTEQVFFTPSNIDNKVLGKYLNIAGGYLKQYDGSNTIFEQGFHLYPEAPTVVGSNGAGALNNNGVYSYIVCWEWTDNQGQIHRSNPSVPTSVTLGAAEDTTTVTVKTLPITNKETRWGDNRTNVVMAVYRTLDTGTTYYRVNQLTTDYVYNDPTATTISFTDLTSDADLGDNSLLYTTGGVVANIGIPSSNLMVVVKNRVFVAGIDTEPNRIYYSKEKEEGVGVEFSNELSLIVDGLGGDITALAAMDDKVLIFKKSHIFFIAGPGPDKVLNGSFSSPQLVSADCGCNSPQSVVLTGAGIMFLSQKGIYLCDGQLQVTYIGQALDSITTRQPTFDITSAVNLPDQNQVYFTTNGSQVLVYDTFFQNWYTHTLKFMPVSGTILNSVWYTSSSDQVYKTVVGQAYDGVNDSIISSLKTNWISLSQLEGFGRIYSIIIVGDNADLDHTLKVNLYYDFEEFPREMLSITPNSLSGAAYGDDATYGSGSPYGGSFDGTYQFMVRPKIQKCTSIQIEIVDEFPTGDKSQSFKFSGLSLVVGIKDGWNKKLSYTRRLR